MNDDIEMLKDWRNHLDGAVGYLHDQDYIYCTLKMGYVLYRLNSRIDELEEEKRDKEDGDVKISLSKCSLCGFHGPLYGKEDGTAKCFDCLYKLSEPKPEEKKPLNKHCIICGSQHELYCLFGTDFFRCLTCIKKA